MIKKIAYLSGALAVAVSMLVFTTEAKKSPRYKKEHRIRWKNRSSKLNPGVHEYKGNVSLDTWLDANPNLILVFYSPSCYACHKTLPVVEKYAKFHPDERILKINTRDYSRIAREYKVRAVPTIVVIRNKRVSYSTRGYKTLPVLEKELEKVMPARRQCCDDEYSLVVY